jgi:uncharacterized tellurite resistance protein B-like protein
MDTQQSSGMAASVHELLGRGRIGHLATISPRGRVSSVPIAYYYDGFIEDNPNVAFQIDNGEVMESAVGVMMQGRAEIYDTVELLRKYRETLPAILQFSKKYPDVFVFYTRHYNKLPEERKFHGYRLIRIVPDRILFWSGYDWGRLATDPGDYGPFFDIHEKAMPKIVARELESLFASLDTISAEERPGEDILEKGHYQRYPKLVDQEDLMSDLFAEAMTDGKVTEDEMEILNSIRSNYRFYHDALKNALSDEVLSRDEFALLDTIKKSLYQSTIDTALKDGQVKDDEARLLKKFAEILNIHDEERRQPLAGE